MLLSEITLGSKAHHDVVAAHQAAQVMTMRKFIQAVKNSTMSDRDMDAVLDELHTAFGHPRALDTKVTKKHIEDLAVITGVDQDELENLAGL